MNHQELTHYRRVQDAARFTMAEITSFIRPGVSEIEIANQCDALQRKAGVDYYWYQSLTALVLVGERTTLAISQTPYAPGERKVKEDDLVTIDLNPAINGYCGDYARSFYVEEGEPSRVPKKNPEFIQGTDAQLALHSLLMEIAEPQMTFNDLYQVISKETARLGFNLLDTIGHNIGRVSDMDQMYSIVAGSECVLGEAGFFTLEPHICLPGHHYGFKLENIYYFDGNKLHEL